MFSAEVLNETFYIAVNWVFRCSLASCFSISVWIFLDRCNVKTLPCQMWNCVCFIFPSAKVKKCLSIAPETSMQTGNMEWPIAMCGYGAPLFVGIQFFEVSASSADCARHSAIYGSRAQLSVISSSSSILVTLCFRRFWFTRYSRVTSTCYSFDVLDLILFWYFRSLSHFFCVGGITSKSISGITPKAIWCSFCYGFLPKFVCFVLIINLFCSSFVFFLNVVHTKLT